MNNQYLKIKSGLRELPSDERDFKFGDVFGKIDISKIPDNFIVATPFNIKNQGELDFCVAFASCSVSEDQEETELNPYWFFSQIKKREGNWRTWGSNIRDACKVAVDVGFISKMDGRDLERDILANWVNWSKDYEVIARKHKKKSYFSINKYGYKDLFDALRGAMWKNRNEKCSIITGALWRKDWFLAENGIIPKKYSDDGLVPHSFKIFGQKMINNELYLVAQNSGGKEMGDNGLYYFPRKVVNRELTFGNFMFYDMPKSEAKILKSCHLSIKWRWLAKIVAELKELLKI